jgi:hypothetical protein
LRLYTHRDNGATNIMHFFIGCVAAQIENSLPQSPVWINIEEGFTQGDEAGNMKN